MLKIVIFIMVSFSFVYAEKHEYFSGIAKENGQIVYLEKHDLTLDDNNNVLEAKTVYTKPDGKVLGNLFSDFRNSLSLPDHVFTDERTKSIYGVRRLDKKIILFRKDDGKKEEKIELPENQDGDRIEIGCQGFSYFLKNKIEELKIKKKQPVLFMIPGDLSTYKFVLELLSENPDKTLDFKVKVENWFLRAFAPELNFKYDLKLHRILWYKGLSNLKNDAGKNMTVEIDYNY